MKVIFFAAAILLSSFYVTAQTVSIPDPYFEQALIGLDIDSVGIINGQVLASDVENVTELLLILGIGEGIYMVVIDEGVVRSSHKVIVE